MIRASDELIRLGQLDGGKSRVVQTSLEPLLDEVRVRLGADISLAVYQSFSNEREICVLAACASPSEELPLPNEPLSFSHGSKARHPSSAQDLVLTSSVRNYRLELAAALLVPWRDVSGRGWLIVGLTPDSWNRGTLDLTRTRGFAERLKDAHRMAGLRGAARLQGDVVRAARFVAEASLETDDVSGFLEAVVVAARTLLGSSVAYISMPDNDPDYFLFCTLLDIQTSDFRRLRMRNGQGLGGLTRENMRSVRCHNYASDSRLRQAPVIETLQEGILSAMCTPLVADGQVTGLLYVGNRHLTPFTETDASLLEEFAGYATLGIRHAEAEQHRLAIMRRREHELLATRLHDSVVRSLMQIGFQAEEGMVIPGNPSLRHRFSIIGKAAEYCLEALRDHLATLTTDSPDRLPPSVGQLFDSLKAINWRPGIQSTFEVTGATLSTTIPYDISQALVRIGREAIANSQLHSSCTHHLVSLQLSSHHVQLSVTDNGSGMTRAQIAQFFSEDSRHLGLRGMQLAARTVGGDLTITPGDGQGLLVTALLPIPPVQHAVA